MKKFIFFSFPLAGHVNPQVGLCKALGEKEAKVIFYTSKIHFSKFNDFKNVELREYPQEFQTYFDMIGTKYHIHHKMLIMLSTFYNDTELLIDFCIQEVAKEKPDVITCDQFAIWGRAAAKYHKVPLCKFFSSIMADEIVYITDPYFKNAVAYMVLTQGLYMFRILGVIRRINRKYGKIVEGINEVMDRGNGLCLVMTSKKFHPGGDMYPENVRFIGADHERVLPSVKKNKIFISLGTISMRPHFFEDCIEATKHLGYSYVITLAGNKKHNINELKKYDNVVIHDNLNFEEYRNVVNESALFISHGGFNGVTTALLYETPLLICPVSPEQINNAKLITKYQCGAGYYKKKININLMRKIVDGIVDNESVNASLKEQSQALCNSLAYDKVADIMLDKF